MYLYIIWEFYCDFYVYLLQSNVWIIPVLSYMMINIIKQLMYFKYSRFSIFHEYMCQHWYLTLSEWPLTVAMTFPFLQSHTLIVAWPSSPTDTSLWKIEKGFAVLYITCIKPTTVTNQPQIHSQTIKKKKKKKKTKELTVSEVWLLVE